MPKIVCFPIYLWFSSLSFLLFSLFSFSSIIFLWKRANYWEVIEWMRENNILYFSSFECLSHFHLLWNQRGHGLAWHACMSHEGCGFCIKENKLNCKIYFQRNLTNFNNCAFERKKMQYFVTMWFLILTDVLFITVKIKKHIVTKLKIILISPIKFVYFPSIII
jgi:hypothetical protein